MARLMTATGAPEKVCQGAMERADRRGLIDWGTTIYYAWPTDAGLALMAELGTPTVAADITEPNQCDASHTHSHTA